MEDLKEEVKNNPDKLNPNPQNISSSRRPLISKKIIIVLIVVSLFALFYAGVNLFLNSELSKITNPKKPSPVACTQDAKICPDGTSVGRTGPNCEFAPCSTKPSLSHNPTTDWNTYKNLGVEFKYPPTFKAKEDSNNKTQDIINFKDNNKTFRLDRIVAPTENEAPFNQTNITKFFNGIVWKVVPPEKSATYCDAGNCGKTAPTYYVYRNGYRYSLTYYSNDLQSVIEDILSTFKFL